MAKKKISADFLFKIVKKCLLGRFLRPRCDRVEEAFAPKTPRGLSGAKAENGRHAFIDAGLDIFMHFVIPKAKHLPTLLLPDLTF